MLNNNFRFGFNISTKEVATTGDSYGDSLTDDWTEAAGYPFNSFSSSGTDITEAIESDGNWAFCSDTFAIEDGEEYKIEFDCTINSGSGIRVQLALSEAGLSQQFVDSVSNGHNIFNHTSIRDNANEYMGIYVLVGNAANFTISNFSIKKKL